MRHFAVPEWLLLAALLLPLSAQAAPPVTPRPPVAAIQRKEDAQRQLQAAEQRRLQVQSAQPGVERQHALLNQRLAPPPRMRPRPPAIGPSGP